MQKSEQKRKSDQSCDLPLSFFFQRIVLLENPFTPLRTLSLVVGKPAQPLRFAPCSLNRPCVSENSINISSAFASSVGASYVDLKHCAPDSLPHLFAASPPNSFEVIVHLTSKFNCGDGRAYRGNESLKALPSYCAVRQRCIDFGSCPKHSKHPRRHVPLTLSTNTTSTSLFRLNIILLDYSLALKANNTPSLWNLITNSLECPIHFQFSEAREMLTRYALLSRTLSSLPSLIFGILSSLIGSPC